MTDKEFQEMLNGKKINWSSGKDNEKLIKGNAYRDQTKRMIEKKKKKQREES